MGVPMRALRREKSARGQVTVELMLVLPVFAFLAFLMMEICNVCFQALVATHMAYECARVAAMAEGKSNRGYGGGQGRDAAESYLTGKVGSRAHIISADDADSASDPQTGQRVYDINLVLEWQVKAIAPGLQGILGLGGLDKLRISVPMSVEVPAYAGG